MTDETLSSFIDKANGLPGPQVVFTQPLLANVCRARAWRAAPIPTDKVGPVDEGYWLYLVQNPAQQFVAAVLDMGEDLHWLVQPAFRGQGYLTRALSSVILPHLLQDREQQRITVSRGLGSKAYQASKKVAHAVGFELLEETAQESVLLFRRPDSYQEKHSMGANQPLAPARIKELRQQFAYHAACIRQMKAEIEFGLGNSSFTESLDDLAADVYDQVWQLEKHWATTQPDAEEGNF